MANNSEKENDLLYRIDGAGCFLKIKQALDIDKMLFSFVQYDKRSNNVLHSIDCYLSAAQFGAILMNSIADKSLLNRIYKEKKRAVETKEQYPKAVWNSPLGGKKNKDGAAVSRSFTIAPGASSEVLFTATECPATESASGAFIPNKGSKDSNVVIRIPATYNDLKTLCYVWSFLEADFMPKRYSVKRMQSTYNRDNGNASTSLPFPA